VKKAIIVLLIFLTLSCATTPAVKDVATEPDDQSILDKTTEALKKAGEWIGDSIGDIIIDPGALILSK